MSSVGTLFPLLVWHLDGQRPRTQPGVHRDEGGRTPLLGVFPFLLSQNIGIGQGRFNLGEVLLKVVGGCACVDSDVIA